MTVGTIQEAIDYVATQSNNHKHLESIFQIRQYLYQITKENDELRYLNAQLVKELTKEQRINNSMIEYIQQPNCNNILRGLGKAYPRTCKVCGLGPCQNPVNAY